MENRRVAGLLAAGVACVLLLASAGALAHEGGTFRGVVRGAEGEPLPLADVRLETADGEPEVGVLSLGDGSFTILAPHPSEYRIRVNYIGYEELIVPVEVRAHQIVAVEVNLVPLPIEFEEFAVQGEYVRTAVSGRTTPGAELRSRPVRNAQDALRVVPGLFIAQHAGGGKAEQIFLRGFDADHGTDVAVTVDGVPVNLVSHGHGQGYADLHFLIPDVIGFVQTRKGPYAVDRGNLATAGQVEMRTLDRLEYNTMHYEIGEFGTHQFTALTQITPPGQPTSIYLAGQYSASDGPVETPQDLQRANLFVKLHHRFEDGSDLRLDTGGFNSAWDASGQIPQRAVDSGLITRFGSIDPLEGGSTARQNLNLRYSRVSEDLDRFQAQVYGFRYRFKLFSNFTFFLEDPENGDMIEQTDERSVLGARVERVDRHEVGGRTARLTVGGDLRSDNVQVGLWRSPDRVRADTIVSAMVFERNFGGYLEEQIDLTDALRLTAGVRGDYFTFDVEDDLDRTVADVPHASGYEQEAILTPKATLRYQASPKLELFTNYGSGFHSNDARAVVLARQSRVRVAALRADGASEAAIDSVLSANNTDRSVLSLGTLPRAHGGEIGLRASLSERFSLGAAAWLLDLEDELVFVGDAGTTEPSGRTRRVGIDFELRAQPLSWLWIDVDVNYADGELRDEPEGANEIPLAPRWISFGGVTAQHHSGLLGSVRYRTIGDRPANEDDSVVALGSTVFDAVVEYRTNRFGMNVVVENVLDTEWNEAQFDTESRLRGKAEPVSELHFTPGNPRNVRAGVSVFW